MSAALSVSDSRSEGAGVAIGVWGGEPAPAGGVWTGEALGVRSGVGTGE